MAAYAQFVGHNYDEAMRLSREAIRQRGDFVEGIYEARIRRNPGRIESSNNVVRAAQAKTGAT